MQEPDFHIIIHFVIFYPERWAVLHSIFFRTLRLPLITQHKHATIHQLTNFLGTPASEKAFLTRAMPLSLPLPSCSPE